MIPDDVQALVLADAIGALDPGERRELDVRLARLPPDAQAEAARLYDVALAVAASADEEPPSAHVRDALLARLEPPHFTIAVGEGEWVDTPFPGIRMKILALDRQRDRLTMLLRGEPGARYPAHRHTAPEECYVLRGSVVVEGQRLVAGDYHYAAPGTDHHEIYTEDGAEVLLMASATDYLPEPT
jgi:anti-sigma factor ChrR (cupin superfamily)